MDEINNKDNKKNNTCSLFINNFLRFQLKDESLELSPLGIIHKLADIEMPHSGVYKTNPEARPARAIELPRLPIRHEGFFDAQQIDRIFVDYEGLVYKRPLSEDPCYLPMHQLLLY